MVGENTLETTGFADALKVRSTGNRTMQASSGLLAGT